MNLLIFYSLLYATHKLDSSKVLLSLKLVFFFDFPQFLELSFHLYDLFFGAGDLITYVVGLFCTRTLFDSRKDISCGFCGLHALFLVDISERLIIDVPS